MQNLYATKIFYPLMNKRIGGNPVRQLRRETLTGAGGAILEIGFGSGLNLACYPPEVRSITAIDVLPSNPPLPPSALQIRRQCMSAERLAFPAASFDSVVSTFTLCSIPDVHAALAEIVRVLKPNGKFFFLEHGQSSNPCIAGLQTLLNPFYNLLACGCNINRDILKIISASGLWIQTSKMNAIGLPFSGLYFSGIAIKKGDPC